MISACGADGGNNAVPEDLFHDNIEVSSTKLPDSETQEQTDTQEPNDTQKPEENESLGRDQTIKSPDLNGNNLELLQSASVDLNKDGRNEQIEAVRISSIQGHETDSQVEGLLRIIEGDSERQISFWKKENGFSGILSSMEFEDLDGDGAKDVFIIIPGSGASFSYSNYFIYSYMKDSAYAFTSDNMLAEFIDGFEPAYINGENKLTLINEEYSFSADLSIEDAGQQDPEATMLEYVNHTWIEPVCVDISEKSRLILKKGAGGKPEIKVPLPIFGMAAVDMIGEIDLFFSVDSSFRPVLVRFELLDFVGNDTVRVGSWEAGSDK